MPKPVPQPEESFMELRNKALSLSHHRLKFEPTAKLPNVWAVLMEIGYPQTAVTLVCIRGGAVDMYFGNGGAVTEGEKHEMVREKADLFLEAAETVLKKLSPTKKFPLPEVDRVRFYVHTYDGIVTTQVAQDVSIEKHELFPLFVAGHEVIAALRYSQEAPGTPA
jgi:hypothetical protein